MKKKTEQLITKCTLTILVGYINVIQVHCIVQVYHVQYLKYADVERSTSLRDALVQQGYAEGDEGSSSNSVKELAREEEPAIG